MLAAELLTDSVFPNTNYISKNIDSKIIDIASSNAFKNSSLDVGEAILIKLHWQTAIARELYEYTDGPTGQSGDNQPDSDRLGVLHWSILGVTVSV